MKQAIKDIISELFGTGVEPHITRPEPQFGDFATNVAMQLAGKLSKNPRDIAETLAEELRKSPSVASAEVAGSGFVNIRVSDRTLRELADVKPTTIYDGVSYVTEYSCPNAFKELHTGHLYQTILGDTMARLVENAGAKVHRTNFGGDVGLHVGKCMYGIIRTLGGENPEKLNDISADPFERAAWISTCYVAGSAAYEQDEAAKAEITRFNTEVYRLHTEHVTDTPFARIYFTCRQWSYDYFDTFYDLIQVDKSFRYYPESSTMPKGLEMVSKLQQEGKLTESNGAVIFPGDEEKHLDARVFITSKNIPTYETKDLGVIFMERDDFDFTRRFLITATEQNAYMKVVFAVADMIQPGIKDQMTHIGNGLVKFADGKKMSSRLGNVARAIDALDIVREKVRSLVTDENIVHDIALGAVKYQFLKYRVGGDIAFDLEESVSLAGNSGPYLQYAHARACSLLAKAGKTAERAETYDENERLLVRKLGEYAEIVDKSTTELMPHYICTYLYELAQEFNRFYEKSRIVGDPREPERVDLVTRYRDVLGDGLRLMGIVAPTKM